MKKKIVSLMLVAALSVSLCACGGGSDKGTETASGTEAQSANGTESGTTDAGPDMTKYGEESADI